MECLGSTLEKQLIITKYLEYKELYGKASEVYIKEFSHEKNVLFLGLIDHLQFIILG